jgi:hypothetical protein
LTEALAGVNFNKDTDTLVVLGDSFDRGDQSLEVLKYIMSCPNRILIWGNHDFRLRELILGKAVGGHDYSNGVLETMKSFCPDHAAIESIEMLINIMQSNSAYEDTYRLLWRYFSECVWAAEWADLSATHGWIPHERRIVGRKMGRIEEGESMMPNWRNATRDEWYNASWAHTELCCHFECYPDKPLIVGHWHAWRFRAMFLTGGMTYRNQEDIDFNTFEYEDKFVAIDGCSNAAYGKVNAWVYETDEKPELIEAW